MTDGPTPGSSADDVPDADPQSVARAILLRQLTMGPRTESQLRQALSKRQVPADVADAVLARFVDVGLIDDAAYAEEFVRYQSSTRSMSRRGMQHRLRQKGVANDIVADAVDRIGPEEERSAALDLAQRRAARMSGLDPATRRRRLTGLLARRGYPSDVVRSVIEDVLGDAEVLTNDAS